MTIFTAKTGIVETLNAREMAPGKAFEEMFVNDTTVQGGKSVAVPGEIKGYWELHQKYGKLAWARLFRPVIDLCRRGHVVSRYLANILSSRNATIKNSPTLAEIYINPETNEVYKQGEYVKRLKLADTLEEIAQNGAATLYGNGTLAQRLVEDIQEDGGIVTVEDLMKYEPIWLKPATRKFENKKSLHSFSLPGSGSLVIFMLNVVNNYLPDGASLRSFQRIAETLKYAYARRSLLGDSEEGVAVANNITLLDYALKIRDKIEDTHTYNDHKYYGGIFESARVSNRLLGVKDWTRSH